MVLHHHLSLLTFLSLLLLITTHARPIQLHPSDHKAFLTIQNDMNINAKRHTSKTSVCNTPGVFCERRLTRNNTYVLRITRLVFKSQHLTGILSPAIGMLLELKELSLPNNDLVDGVPYQIINLKKLEILDLRNNKFSGVVPSELSKLTRLRILDLSFNEFSGNLTFLKNLTNLERLSIGNNDFIGKVPDSLRSLCNLQFFDLADDSGLTGSLPKRYVLAESPLSTSNVLAGSPVSTSGIVVPPSMAPEPAAANGQNQTKSDRNDKKKRKHVAGYIIGFVAGAIGGLLSGFVFSIMVKLVLAAIRGGGRDPGPAIFSPGIKKADLEFLEKDDGLASLEIIGKGGCGEVYRAQLPGTNGKMIAIKKVIQPPKDAAELTEEDTKALNKKMRQIRSEINTVGKIRHRNLLPLLAHISRPDCHYLVYEFMKNGSLQDMLSQVSQGNRELDWPARHKIALGVAAALEYLHMNHSPRIIHRDLKPANILLDDDMEARIADFGLAKAMPDANTHMSTSNVAGTIGYIAPEYHQTLKFTDKCDIYSFGVMLAVLAMGKLPSDEFFQNTSEMSLVRWLRNTMVSENPSQAIDPNLMGKGVDEQMLLVLKIACFCTMDDPRQRPNSKEVRCMIDQIKI